MIKSLDLYCEERDRKVGTRDLILTKLCGFTPWAANGTVQVCVHQSDPIPIRTSADLEKQPQTKRCLREGRR